MSQHQTAKEVLESIPEPGVKVLQCPVCHIWFDTNPYHKTKLCIVCAKEVKTAQLDYNRTWQREYHRRKRKGD